MDNKPPSVMPNMANPTNSQHSAHSNRHMHHMVPPNAGQSHPHVVSQQQILQQHQQHPLSSNNNSMETEVMKYFFPSLGAPIQHSQMLQMVRSGNSAGPSPPRSGGGIPSTGSGHYASPSAIMAASPPAAVLAHGPQHHGHQKSLPASSHSPSSCSAGPSGSAGGFVATQANVLMASPSGATQHGRSHSGSNHLQLVQSSQSTSSSISQNTPVLRASALLPLLQRCIVLLSGGRDRRGGPILTFPSNTHADEFPLEDLYLLVRYYTFLPEERVKQMGFTVVVDMRGGTTWHSVKPLLKVLDECIGDGVEITYIIKPEKFLEKQRASLSAAKYNFEVMLVSMEHLLKELDVTQLTPDIGGTLTYNHKEWLHLRLAMEEFFTLAHEMSDKFCQLYNHMERLAKQGDAHAGAIMNPSQPSASTATSGNTKSTNNNISQATQQQKHNSAAVAKAKQLFEELKALYSRIYHAPVRFLERKAETLLFWLRYGVVQPSSPHQISWVAKNSDFQQLIPQVSQTINSMYEQKDRVQKKWEAERQKLEQLHQLSLFKDDLGRMSIWLQQQRDLFLTEYLDIGETASQAADLYSEQRQFLHNCSNVREQVVRLTSVARMLADGGHFASAQILSQAMELEHEWKSFTTALEDRSRVLQLSASFHARAEAFLANCPHWDGSIRQLRGDEIPTLNRAMGALQELWREAQTAHEEVCSDGRALVNHLSVPVPRGSHTSLTAAVDYSEGRRHCTDLVHELWSWFKRLESAHSDRRKRLSARLNLLVYKEDVMQVIAWLREHGEPFLERQICVGKSVQRAEQLYNAHMQFEQVASNTLTNAEKLISAADDLAAKADDPEEILQEATGLQRRMTAFTSRVRERRDTLDVACGFYGHVKELFAYFQRVRDTQNPGEHLPASIEGMEDELHVFHKDKKNMEGAYERVCNEGKLLLERMRDEDEVHHLRSLLQQVMNEKNVAQEIFTERQIRLDLCLQLRLLEADVASAIHCLRYEVPPMESVPTGEDPIPLSIAGMVGCGYDESELTCLEESLAACHTACKIAEDVYQKGTELLTAFDQVQVNFPAGGPGSSDSGVGDSVEYAVERVQRMLQELQDFLVPVDHMKERFSLELEWRRDYEQSRSVLHWIRNGEALLHSTALIPGNLSEAEQLKGENEKFQVSLNKAHPEVMNSATRLEYLLHKCTTGLAGNGVSGREPFGEIDENARLHKERRKDSVTKVMDEVTTGWQSLVHVVEVKHKLLTTAVSWYKISDQVFSVLQSLEKDYHRDEEWCQNFKPPAPITTESVLEYMNGVLAKHVSQKESFLKACILARRTSESFLKLLTKQPNGTAGKPQIDQKTRTTMAELMNKEQSVLEAWANRKRRMDECMTYLNFKRDVENILNRVANFERTFKSDTTELERQKSSLEPALRRLCEISEAFEFLFHGPLVKELMLRVKVAFPQFSCSSSFLTDTNQSPFTISGNKLSRGSSITPRASVSSGLPMDSDSAIGSDSSRRASSITSASTTTSSGNSSVATLDQKMMNRRENLLRELIHTEKTYVRDLKDCLNTYRTAMSQPAALDLQLPKAIEGREDTIFSNMRGIYEFHERDFLPELHKYAGDFLPEDVGHCFVTHAEKLASLYVEYCVNKTDSSQLLIDGAGNFFTSVQQKLKLTEPLQSYLIKPVQRITKYQLILRELLDCCDPGAAGELKEGMESMLSVPKKANNALHFSMLIGYPDGDLSQLGEVILQDECTVWEPKQIIKKSRIRRVFLFDSCLILSKELPSLAGEHKKRYQYKSRLMLAEFNIKEHFEGDQCKFALWSGRVPPSVEYRLILRAPNLDTKQAWVRLLREAIQEHVLTAPIYSSGDPSGGSSDTRCFYTVMKDYKLGTFGVTTNQRLEVLEHRGDQCLCRIPLTQQEGWVPCNILTPVQSHPSTSQHPPTRRGSSAGAIVRKFLPSTTSAATPKSPDTANMEAVLKYGVVGNQSSGKFSADGQQDSLAANAASISVAAAGLLLMDDVSEESVEVELPPPMELQQDLPAVSGNATDSAYITSGDGVPDSCSATETEETDQEDIISHSTRKITSSANPNSKKSSKSEKLNDELGIVLSKSLRSSQRMHIHNAKLEALSPRTGVNNAAKNSLNGASPTSDKEHVLHSDPSNNVGDVLTSGRGGSHPVVDRGLRATPPPAYSGDSLYSYNTMTSSTSSASAASSTLGGTCGGATGGASASAENPASAQNDVQQLWQRRWLALRSLVASEGLYVEHLTMGMHYSRALERGIVPPSKELAEQWPLIWGNWTQLTEWHSCFLQRLQFHLQQHEQVYQLALDTLASSLEENENEFQNLHESLEERMQRLQLSNVTQVMDFTHEIGMANLFSDYAGRLRVMYSKYCDNLASRAQQVVQKHIDWFVALRQQLGLREDVSSLLMQPVQRASDYAPHMQELLRISRKLSSPPGVTEAWDKAHAAMKAVPAKTKLIMGAARIEGYEGKICNLGDVRLSEEMRISCLSNSSTLLRQLKSQVMVSDSVNNRMVSSLELRRIFLFEQALLITETVSSPGKEGEEQPDRSPEGGDGSTCDPLVCDILSQCQYRYITQIMVNKMRFHPTWPPTDGSQSGISSSLYEPLLSKLSDRSLCFAISDSTYGRDLLVLFDPPSAESRGTWLRELAVMQRMQREIQQRLGKSSKHGSLPHTSPSHVPYSPPGPLFRENTGSSTLPYYQQYPMYNMQQQHQQQQDEEHTPQPTNSQNPLAHSHHHHRTSSASSVNENESNFGLRTKGAHSSSNLAIDNALITSTTSATSTTSTEGTAAPGGKSSKKKHNIFSIFN